MRIAMIDHKYIEQIRDGLHGGVGVGVEELISCKYQGKRSRL